MGAGELPPPEAYLPEHRSTLIELIYFRWAEAGVMSYRDQPHCAEWMEALRASRESPAS